MFCHESIDQLFDLKKGPANKVFGMVHESEVCMNHFFLLVCWFVLLLCLLLASLCSLATNPDVSTNL